MAKLDTKSLCASYQKVKSVKVSPKSQVPAPSVSKRVKMLMRAQHLISIGQFDSAECILAGLLAKDPTDPNTLFGMGQVMYGKKNFKDAINYYKKVLEQKEIPLWIKGWALVKMGYALYHEGRTEEAIPYFKKASTMNGNARGAARAAVRALEKLGSVKR